MWAIIGGSGFESFEQVEVKKDLNIETPFGTHSSGLKLVSVDGEEALFLSRHGAHHELTPSEINFRANIYALKKAGAKGILSVSAVGSLKKEYKPGDAVIPTQYIDRTKSLRKHTFCGEGVVGHVSLAKPVLPSVVEAATPLWKDLSFDIHYGGTYLCIEGPCFSTQAESLSYIEMGATIIGMTNYPEFALAREAGMVYLPISFVTDYDCWDDAIEHVTLAEVIEVMRKNNAKAFEMVEKAVKNVKLDSLNHGASEMGLKTGLMTPIENIPEDKKAWLEILRA